MIDSVLLVGMALAAGGALVIAPVATSLAAVVIAVLLLRAGARRRVVGTAILALALGALRARGAVDHARDRYAGALAALVPPRRCELQGIVVSSPVVLRDRAALGGDQDGRVDVDFVESACSDGAREPLRARLYGAREDLLRGDRVEAIADIAPVHLFENEGGPSPWPSIARTGVVASGSVVDLRLLARGGSIGSWIDRARARVRVRIEATFHAEAADLARALVLGETDLEAEDDQAFRSSGLAHLLAVSGTHLVIAVVGLVAALRALLLRCTPLAARIEVGRIAALVAIPAVWVYADFAGGGGSAMRAAAMLSGGLGARALGRRTCTPRAFAWSLVAAAAWEPLVVCNVSFTLSAAATAGLLLLSRPIAARIVRGPKFLAKPLTAVAATLAAMLPCTPLLASLSPTLPALGVLANVVAAPLGELAALPVCLAHAVLWWAPAVERGAAIVGSGALLSVRAIARVTAAAPIVVPVPPPDPIEIAVLAVASVAAVLARRPRDRLGVAFAGVATYLLCEGVAIRAGAPRGTLRVSVLDVGQGDSALIDLPDGRAMLIDGGGFVGSPVDPGTRVILPLLRQRRRGSLDVVVLSHPHPDHFGGLVSALPQVHVGELWDTGQGEADGAGDRYASLLAGARERAVPIRRPADLCGPPRALGGATVQVLAPCPGFDPDLGANDNSFVLRLRFGARSALLVGDAEQHEEASLVRAHRMDVHADFLKVGHHGSRTSSGGPFLDAVSPALAAISSGVRNRFGHPHPMTLAALEAHGIPVIRTDRGGEAVWETDGETMSLSRPAAIPDAASLLRWVR